MESSQSVLQWIQEWFLSQCDGVWEHSRGIKIETLDNPGWMVTIDLAGTKVEGFSMAPDISEISEDDWINCTVVEKQFRGYSGPRNLTKILEVFREIICDKSREADGV